MKPPKPKQAKYNWFDSLFINPTGPYLIIVIISVALYLQILTFGLVHFDDHGFVLLSADMLKPSNIPAFFNHSVFWVFGEANKDKDVYYRPLQNVAYTICNTISPRQPWSYHLMSLLFHVLTCCALFSFFTELKYSKAVSLLASLIYCVHPILVQSVAWIAGLGDQMATLFVLISATYFIKLVNQQKLNVKYLLIHLLALVAAMFSKEISLALIPLCLFYYLFISRSKTKTSALGFALGGWVVFAAIFLALRSNALEAGKTGIVSAGIESLRVNGFLIYQYIGKIFWPYYLNPMPLRDDAQLIKGPTLLHALAHDARFIFTLTVLLAMAVVFIIKKRVSALSLFGAGWFLIFIIPTLFQVNPQTDFYAFEHRIYLPLIGMLIILMELVNVNGLKLNTRYYKYGFVLLFLILFTSTFVYSRNFKDEYGFHEKVIQLSPTSSLAYNTYAEILLEDKKYPEAIEAYKKSFQYKSTDINTSGKIGDIYLSNLNDAPDAIIWFKKTLDVNPKTVEAAVSIADAYYNVLHDTTNAQLWYSKSLEIDPKNEFALAKLGVIAISKGKSAEGKKLLMQALQQDDKNQLAYTWLAIAYFNEGNFADAATWLNKEYQFYPNDANIQRNLLICYYKLNNAEQTKRFADIYSSGGNQVPAEILGYLKNK